MSSGEKKVARDNYLFREGDHPDAMYIIKSGGFSITKTKGNSEVVLAEIGPGGMVGEMAIFDRKPRSANVKATKDSVAICLPYDALSSQLEQMPVWLKAIMRTMNDNLREANKKIKILESNTADEERYPPHMINKLLSILNLVGFKFGQIEEGNVVVPAGTLRRYTIQIFQEPTNKMNSLLGALKEMNYFTIEDLGEGKQRLVNLAPDLLINFVDWYNDWLFKQEKDKYSLSADEVKLLKGLAHFAAKVTPDAKGNCKLNLQEIQNDSMRDLGYLIKVEEINSLIEKKLVSEKIMEETGVFISLIMDNINAPMKYWGLIHDFKRYLR